MSERNSYELYKNKMTALQCCVIIPTYNNQQTLASVISDVLNYSSSVIVVNDGALDATGEIVAAFKDQIEIIAYFPNKGKGFALRSGIKYAQKKGFRYAITIDSDGQHYADDIPLFINKIEEEPDSLIVGARNLTQENMPKKNTFGNKFSNFWFHFQTGIKLPDTQSGFRLYPIAEMKGSRYFTSKYEFEIEVMVKAAWRGINILSVPVKVFYAEKNVRVTHFRPGIDFIRISILNVYLTILTLLWYKPIRLVKGLNRKNLKSFVQRNFLDTNESVIKKSAGAAFGVFMGIVPIWGYQFVTALILAHFMKLNKAIVGLTAQISIPPMIPFILFASLKTGQYVLGKDMHDNIFNQHITIERVKLHLFEYIIGSMVFAVIMAVLFGLTTYIVLKSRRTNSSLAD